MSTSVICYAAKSTDGESSIASQLAEIAKSVDAEGGREIVASFSDNAASAYKSEHAEGVRGAGAVRARREAEKLAKTGAKVEFWVFISSRLARGDGKSAAHLAEWLIWAIKNDVQLRSVSDDMSVRDLAFAGMAGAQNNKYSDDISKNVTRGKRTQREEGKRMGGPVPDGYMSDKAREWVDKGRVKVGRYIADPERAPVILEMFALAEQGLGDAMVARTLNERGYRRQSGKPWDRRFVQSLVMNPMYCGIHHTTEDGQRVLYASTDTDPLISVERWEAVMAGRKVRDRSKAGREDGLRKAKGAGNLTVHFALSRLARCGRCGESMYCRPGTKRKDGTKSRYYQCSMNHDGAKGCSQRMIDGAAVDTMLVHHLREYFNDFGAWSESLRNAANADAELASREVRELEAELVDLARVEKGGKLKIRELLTAGKDVQAELVTETLADARGRAQDATVELEAARVRLASLRSAAQPTDSMLAYWTRMAENLFGRIKPGSPMGDVNRELIAALSHVTLDVVKDTITVQAVQKVTGLEFDPLTINTAPALDNVIELPFSISDEYKIAATASALNPDTPTWEYVGGASPQAPLPERVAALQSVNSPWEPLTLCNRSAPEVPLLTIPRPKRHCRPHRVKV